MQTTNTPRDLFFDQLRDLYSMEVQLCEAMPHLVSLSATEGLRESLIEHAHQNCNQIAEIGAIFDRHGKSPGDDKCKAIAGLIEGGNAHLAEVEEPYTRDLMMLAHCLRIEHYEMAAYEITTRLAGKLGLVHEPGILGELLAEEREMAASLLEMEENIFAIASSTA